MTSDVNLNFKKFTRRLEIEAWLDRHSISDYWIVGLKVSVENNVDLSRKAIDYFPFEFDRVEGFFDCSYNNLTSLCGVPKFVGGSFWCENNALTSLEFSPVVVENDFNCHDNALVSLLGCSEKIWDGFYADHNCLTSLYGGPREVNSDYDCQYNRLTSLLDAPHRVAGSFNCSHNLIENLSSIPQSVGERFFCHNNALLGEAQNIQDYAVIKHLHEAYHIELEEKKLQSMVTKRAAKNNSQNSQKKSRLNKI